MSHTCTVDTHTHTHIFVYYNIIDQTNAADAHVVFWSIVDQPPRTRGTYAHTNTRARSGLPTRTANRAIILTIADGFHYNIVVIIIIFAVRRIPWYTKSQGGSGEGELIVYRIMYAGDCREIDRKR